VKSRIIFWVNLAFGIVVLAYVLRTYGGPALGVLRLSPSLPLLLAFLALIAATIGCLSYRWMFILRGLSETPGLATLALQRSAAHSLAVLVPSGKLGGDPLRAWLATQARVPAGESIASVTADRMLEIAATAPFSMVFAALLLQQGVPALESAFVTVCAGTAGLGVGVFLAVRRLRTGKGLVSALAYRMGAGGVRSLNSRLEVIESAESAIMHLLEQPRRMFTAFVIGLVANVLVLAEFGCLLAAFDLPASPTAIVAAIFATGAAHMLPVPAGIGVLEGAMVWIFGVLGYPAEIGLAVGLIVRSRELLWMVPGLIYMMVRSIAAARDRVRAV